MSEEQKRVIFEQDCEEFRSLNGFLWQVPVIVSTLTGGLWFGAAKVGEMPFIQASLFLLAGIVNISFVIVLWRLRSGVMEPLLVHITAYQSRPRSGRKYTMIIVFTFLLCSSAILSFTAFAMKVVVPFCNAINGN